MSAVVTYIKPQRTYKRNNNARLAKAKYACMHEMLLPREKPGIVTEGFHEVSPALSSPSGSNCDSRLRKVRNLLMHAQCASILSVMLPRECHHDGYPCASILVPLLTKLSSQGSCRRQCRCRCNQTYAT